MRQLPGIITRAALMRRSTTHGASWTVVRADSLSPGHEASRALRPPHDRWFWDRVAGSRRATLETDRVVIVPKPEWPVAFFDEDYLRIYRPQFTPERTAAETRFIADSLTAPAGGDVLDL